MADGVADLQLMPKGWNVKSFAWLAGRKAWGRLSERGGKVQAVGLTVCELLVALLLAAWSTHVVLTPLLCAEEDYFVITGGASQRIQRWIGLSEGNANSDWFGAANWGRGLTVAQAMGVTAWLSLATHIIVSWRALVPWLREKMIVFVAMTALPITVTALSDGYRMRLDLNGCRFVMGEAELFFASMFIASIHVSEKHQDQSPDPLQRKSICSVGGLHLFADNASSFRHTVSLSVRVVLTAAWAFGISHLRTTAIASEAAVAAFVIVALLSAVSVAADSRQTYRLCRRYLQRCASEQDHHLVLQKQDALGEEGPRRVSAGHQALSQSPVVKLLQEAAVPLIFYAAWIFLTFPTSTKGCPSWSLPGLGANTPAPPTGVHWPEGADVGNGDTRDRIVDAMTVGAILSIAGATAAFSVALSTILQALDSDALLREQESLEAAATLRQAIGFVSHGTRGPLNAAMLSLGVLQRPSEQDDAGSAAGRDEAAAQAGPEGDLHPDGLADAQDDKKPADAKQAGEASAGGQRSSALSEQASLISNLQSSIRASALHLDLLVMWDQSQEGSNQLPVACAWDSLGEPWRGKLSAKFRSAHARHTRLVVTTGLPLCRATPRDDAAGSTASYAGAGFPSTTGLPVAAEALTGGMPAMGSAAGLGASSAWTAHSAGGAALARRSRTGASSIGAPRMDPSAASADSGLVGTRISGESRSASHHQPASGSEFHTGPRGQSMELCRMNDRPSALPADDFEFFADHESLFAISVSAVAHAMGRMASRVDSAVVELRCSVLADPAAVRRIGMPRVPFPGISFRDPANRDRAGDLGSQPRSVLPAVLQFEVRDSGPPIPKEALESGSLFRPFGGLKLSGQGAGTTGLSLSTVLGIALTSMRGEVGLASGESEGALVFARVPVWARRRPVPPSIARSARDMASVAGSSAVLGSRRQASRRSFARSDGFESEGSPRRTANPLEPASGAEDVAGSHGRLLAAGAKACGQQARQLPSVLPPLSVPSKRGSPSPSSGHQHPTPNSGSAPLEVSEAAAGSIASSLCPTPEFPPARTDRSAHDGAPHSPTPLGPV